jgi:hypothetical protein
MINIMNITENENDYRHDNQIALKVSDIFKELVSKHHAHDTRSFSKIYSNSEVNRLIDLL